MKIVDDNNDSGKAIGPTDNPSINAHLKDAEWLACEKCGCKTFVEAMQIKKISKFLTGSERDSIAPMPVIACASCGHVNAEMQPNI